MTGKVRDVTFDGRGKMILSLLINENAAEEIDAIADAEIEIALKKKRQKRSRNANDYFWELCTKIAENQGITKEEVYRHEIREVGVYEPLPVRIDALERFTREWSARGVGWVVDVIDDSFPGYKKVFAYYGSSTYDTAEMSRLISNTVQDAKALGITTETPEQQALLIERWR